MGLVTEKGILLQLHGIQQAQYNLDSPPASVQGKGCLHTLFPCISSFMHPPPCTTESQLNAPFAPQLIGRMKKHTWHSPTRALAPGPCWQLLTDGIHGCEKTTCSRPLLVCRKGFQRPSVTWMELLKQQLAKRMAQSRTQVLCSGIPGGLCPHLYCRPWTSGEVPTTSKLQQTRGGSPVQHNLLAWTGFDH